MTHKTKSFEEWVRSPGIYASYSDYVRGVEAAYAYLQRLERERLIEDIARKKIQCQKTS
jgi:Arc/MetJ-type ribon-helix-helix transcriptional regulator